MKKLYRSLIVAIVFLLPLAGKSDEKLESLQSIYAGEMDKIVSQYLTDMEAVNKAYLGYLDAELKKATDKGDLNGYKKTEEEKTRFQEEKTVPANTPVQGYIDQAELRKNAAIISLSKKYLVGLNSHKIALMRSKDIKGASSVQDEVKKIEAIVTELASKLPATPAAGRATGVAQNGVAASSLPLALKKGLVLWYGFDKDEEEKVTDKSGKGNHGKAGGGSWAQNARRLKNGAYQFNGADETIDIGNQVKPPLPMTVAVWVNLKELDKQADVFMNDEYSSKQYAGVLMGCKRQNGQLFVRMGGLSMNPAGRREKSAAEGSLSTGEWHHIAAVWEAHDKIQLFLDGEARDGVYGGSGTKLVYSDKNGRVGGFRGSIDELLVYDRALSEADIKKIYTLQGGK